MIRAKHYETASKFVKVMQRKLVASFFRTWCIAHYQKISNALKLLR